MRALLRIGFTLLVLAFGLIGVSYAMLRTQGGGTSAIPGSRLIATDKRELDADVTRLELNAPVNLTLRQGTTASLEVRGEQRLLANVDTHVDGATLHIGTRGILLRHRTPIEVTVTLPALEALAIKGSGDYTVSGFAGDHLELSLDSSGDLHFNGRYREIVAALHGSGDCDLTGGTSDRVEAELVGSGNLTLVGATRELHTEVHGSGDLDARHLRADDVELVHQGSGSSTVYASRQVHAEMTGSGDVVIYGNPNERSVSRNGSGSIAFRD